MSARFDVSATVTEQVSRILKTVLKLMFLKMTQAKVKLCNKFYTYDILTVEKTILGWSNKF